MRKAVSSNDRIRGAKPILPFDQIALVLKGGGALGAYQAGVFQAIHKAGICLDWICGTSIGAISGALISGNRADECVDKLRHSPVTSLQAASTRQATTTAQLRVVIASRKIIASSRG
jgi:predicted acylesterase/phospholipase RssA